MICVTNDLIVLIAQAIHRKANFGNESMSISANYVSIEDMRKKHVKNISKFQNFDLIIRLIGSKKN